LVPVIEDGIRRLVARAGKREQLFIGRAFVAEVGSVRRFVEAIHRVMRASGDIGSLM
jgi:hypothetical protein